MRDRLLREENLTLDKHLQICRATELSRENSKTLQGQTVEEVHALKQTTKKDKDNEISCKFCGRTHEKNKKPSFWQCGKDNHFSAKCKTQTESNRKVRPVHAVAEEDSGTYEDIMTITEVGGNSETVNHVKESHSHSQQLFAGMMIGKTLADLQIDHLLNPDTQLEPTEKVLLIYNKTELKPLGKCNVEVRNPRNNKQYRLEFQMVDHNDTIPLFVKS